MKKKFKLYFTFFFLSNIPIAFTQNAHKQLREADTHYQNKDFKTSEEKYKKADELQPSDRTRYNLGNAMYQQQRLEEAIKQYESVAKQPNATPDVRAKALHNLGNIQYQQKAYQKAVDSYRNALKINPKDATTKRNLAIAQKYLQQPPPPQNQQNQQNQQGGGANNKNNQQQQPPKPEDQNKDKNNNQQQNQQNNGQNQQDNQDNSQNNGQNQSQQAPMSHDELRQMLQIMENEEKKVQQRLQKGKPKPSRSAKDW